MPDHGATLLSGPHAISGLGSFAFHPFGIVPAPNRVHVEVTSYPASVGTTPIGSSGLVELYGAGKFWIVSSLAPNGVIARLPGLFSAIDLYDGDYLPGGHDVLVYYTLEPGVTANVYWYD